MALNKMLKLRLSEAQLAKAEADSIEVAKLNPKDDKPNVSKHIRNLIENFDIVDYKRDLEMGIVKEGE